MREFEVIRKTAENIFFVAHRQIEKVSALCGDLFYFVEQNSDPQRTKCTGQRLRAPLVTDAMSRGWRSGRNCTNEREQKWFRALQEGLRSNYNMIAGGVDNIAIQKADG